MRPNAIADTIANQFGLAQAPTLLARCGSPAPIAFTRLQNNGEFHGRTMTVPPDAAFSFQVALAPMTAGDLWIGGQRTDLMASESDSKVHAGLQSLRNMRRMDAKRRNMRAVRLRFSQSLASLRQRLSQAIVRSTIQRLGRVTKPFA